MFFKRSLLLPLVSIAMIFATTMQTQASASLEKAIDVAGSQRMLSQKLSKELLLIYLGIEPEKNIQNVQKTHTLFSQNLYNLVFGNEKENLPPIVNKESFNNLIDVYETWNAFDYIIEDVVEKRTVSKQYIIYLSQTNVPLLKLSNTLVQSITKAADDGSKSISKAKANTINIAGRQRMLSQKMVKEALFIAAKEDITSYQEELKSTFKLFNTSFSDLKTGNRSKDIIAPPNDAILQQLSLIDSIWEKLAPTIEKAFTTGKLSSTDINTLTLYNLTLLKELNNCVKLYNKS